MNLDDFKKEVQDGKIKDKWYFYKRTEQNKIDLVQDMKSLTNIIKDKFDCDIYLVYGTLLGAIREQNFMEHDNDVDFAYLSKKDNKKDIQNEFLELTLKLKENNMLSKICSNGHLHVWSPNQRHKFDLWTSFIINNKYSIVPLVDAEIDSSVIIPLQTQIFKNNNFLFPAHPELFLNHIYNNWQTPIFGYTRGLKKQWKKLL